MGKAGEQNTVTEAWTYKCPVAGYLTSKITLKHLCFGKKNHHGVGTVHAEIPVWSSAFRGTWVYVALESCT